METERARWGIRPTLRYVLRELPFLLVLLVVAAGMVAVHLGYWRKGSILIGTAPIAASFLRLLLSTRSAGLLAVRSKPFDVLVPLVFGVTFVILALTVPPNIVAP